MSVLLLYRKIIRVQELCVRTWHSASARPLEGGQRGDLKHFSLIKVSFPGRSFFSSHILSPAEQEQQP